MLGQKPKIFKVHPALTLEALVPSSNFYRHVEQKLDVSIVRDLVKDCYASGMGVSPLTR